MSRRKKAWLFSFAGAAGLLLVALFAAVGLVRTDWFKNKVRARIVSVAETATGGRVEIGTFDYNWQTLTVEVAPFVIHGKESPQAAPFFLADRIRIGLRVISFLDQQVDLVSLAVERPQISVIVNPDGSTNLPEPKSHGRWEKNFAEQLLDLKVQHFELHDGFAEYNSKRIPLDVQGDRLQASITYQKAQQGAGPRYVGTISSRRVRFSSPQLRAPLALDVDAQVALERNQFQVLHASLEGDGSKLAVDGLVRDLSSPRADFNVTATAPVKALNATFALPLESAGVVSFQGKASVVINPLQLKLEGKLAGRELAIVRNGVRVPDISFFSRLDMTPAKISLPDLQLFALHGRFRGSAQLVDFKKFSLNGTAADLSLGELAGLAKRDSGQLSGTLNGPIRLDGEFSPAGAAGVVLDAKLDIVPGTSGVPVKGAIDINYDQRAAKVRLGNSEVSIGSTSVSVSGTLGETLNIHFISGNLHDTFPLFPLFGAAPPEHLLVSLHGGVARFDGSVTGPIADAKISGKADVTHLVWDQREFDHVVATLNVDKTLANLYTLAVDQGQMHIVGQARIGLVDWKAVDASALSASLSIRGADIQKLLADKGSQIPISGALSATAHITGTVESPLVSGSVDARNVTAYDEQLDRVRGDVTMTATALEVANFEARVGAALIAGSGAYNHLANDWNDGALRVDLATDQLSLARISHVRQFRDGLGGDLDIKGSGTAKVVKGVVTLASLNGQLTLKNATLDGRPYGNLELTANTRLPMLALTAKVNLRGVQLEGTGDWRMDGDYPGQARIQIPRITFATLHDLWPGEHERKDLPFEGFIQGEATLAGPLNNPAAITANVTLSTVQLSAGPNVKPVAGTQIQDLVLKNAQPVMFEGTTKSIDIRSANFMAKDTTLAASGRLALDSKNPWDLAVKGNINLSILQIFNPDLLASGTSLLDMTVRGPLTEPQVDGRVELHNASLYIRDLPNGVDQANGLILFDRNRATIQNLTGVTGGGTVAFESGSFIGFRGTALIYRLQATATQVRYRSIEGVSVTMNATLNLAGTSENSVLSGNVAVVRAGFNPRTDVGSLLASTATPVSSTPNEYLRGIQFDVRITSSRNLEVETALTRNIQADATLRLRGTPERPVVLGNVSVSSGEIEFFGNKYSISRGDINFYNPAKIEPIIDLDLETRTRGIVVDITFSGPLNKLNFSYRSDPPLETNEIISLLAVGRTPTESGGLASTQSITAPTGVSTGNNTLLSQAFAPPSGRLQRFFGVSHIKIDPQLTDITSVPQARLNLEQQVSPDITFTYITNLARTDQQIVRIEWALSKRWSVVALRDENGAFGIDVQVRKRFK
jgi:translocation and assembly module TamB